LVNSQKLVKIRYGKMEEVKELQLKIADKSDGEMLN
jgi:hypothetical protein